MRAPQIGFAQLVQDFFLRRLVAQRGASARTVEAYRDAFELLLGFAEQRTGKPAAALALADLDAPLVLDFLDHLETERGNSVHARCDAVGDHPGAEPVPESAADRAASAGSRRSG